MGPGGVTDMYKQRLSPGLNVRRLGEAIITPGRKRTPMDDWRVARLRSHILGERRPRRRLALGVGGLVTAASVGFLLGSDAVASTGWIALSLAVALAAGAAGAGVGPTAGSLWLLGFWWSASPPIVGYLTGEWRSVSRYTYPRMLDYAHGSARYEAIGGIEQGIRIGLLFAVVLGTVGYLGGLGASGLWRAWRQRLG